MSEEQEQAQQDLDKTADSFNSVLYNPLETIHEEGKLDTINEENNEGDSKGRTISQFLTSKTRNNSHISLATFSNQLSAPNSCGGLLSPNVFTGIQRKNEVLSDNKIPRRSENFELFDQLRSCKDKIEEQEYNLDGGIFMSFKKKSLQKPLEEVDVSDFETVEKNLDFGKFDGETLPTVRETMCDLEASKGSRLFDEIKLQKLDEVSNRFKLHNPMVSSSSDLFEISRCGDNKKSGNYSEMDFSRMSRDEIEKEIQKIRTLYLGEEDKDSPESKNPFVAVETESVEISQINLQSQSYNTSTQTRENCLTKLKKQMEDNPVLKVESKTLEIAAEDYEPLECMSGQKDDQILVTKSLHSPLVKSDFEESEIMMKVRETFKDLDFSVEFDRFEKSFKKQQLRGIKSEVLLRNMKSSSLGEAKSISEGLSEEKGYSPETLDDFDNCFKKIKKPFIRELSQKKEKTVKKAPPASQPVAFLENRDTFGPQEDDKIFELSKDNSEMTVKIESPENIANDNKLTDASSDIDFRSYDEVSENFESLGVFCTPPNTKTHPQYAQKQEPNPPTPITKPKIEEKKRRPKFSFSGNEGNFNLDIESEQKFEVVKSEKKSGKSGKKCENLGGFNDSKLLIEVTPGSIIVDNKPYKPAVIRLSTDFKKNNDNWCVKKECFLYTFYNKNLNTTRKALKLEELFDIGDENLKVKTKKIKILG